MSKQKSQGNLGNHLDKDIESENIFHWGSSNDIKSSNLVSVENPNEQSKSKQLDEAIAMPKVKYSRTNVHLRKDVVNKSIIRAFSRFYNNNFISKFKFDGDAEDLADFIADSGVENLITSSIDYQEHFSITNEEGSKSKLLIILKVICFWIWN